MVLRTGETQLKHYSENYGAQHPCRLVSIGATLSLAFALLTASLEAQATDRAYSYGSIGYANTDGLDALAGSGSYEVGGNVRIVGGASYAETRGFTLRTFSLGAGYIARLSASTDLILDAGVLNVENQVFFIDAGDDNWGGFGGATLRFAAGESVDIEPSLSYVKLFDVDFGDDDQFVYGVTARFWVASRLALEVGINDSKDARDPTFSFGMRFGPKNR